MIQVFREVEYAPNFFQRVLVSTQFPRQDLQYDTLAHLVFHEFLCQPRLPHPAFAEFLFQAVILEFPKQAPVMQIFKLRGIVVHVLRRKQRQDRFFKILALAHFLPSHQ